MGVVSKSGSGGISRTCPLFPPTTDIRRGERHVWFVPTADLHKLPEGVRVDLDGRQRRDAPCGSVADQRGKHEIKGCRQFDPAPVGRLVAAAGISVCGVS
jgi:hypothetical protein